MMELKIIEWNIHGADDVYGYEMPSFVTEEILNNQKPDVFVLTEFIGNTSSEEAMNRLRTKYTLYDNFKNGNAVLIGVKNTLNIVSAKSYELIPEPDMPNFLGLELVFDPQKKINIIGMRTRILLRGSKEAKSTFKIKQLSMVNRFVEQIEGPYFLIGDLNVLGSWLNKPQQRETWNCGDGGISVIPEYSAAWKNPWRNEIAKAPLDNFIYKDVVIGQTKYDWDFRNKHGNHDIYFSNSDELILPVKKGYPDHAILSTSIAI